MIEVEVFDRKTRLLVVFFSIFFCFTPNFTQGNQLKIKWDERVEVASAGAYRGPCLMNESEWDYVDDSSVAINDKGMTAVAWVDQAAKDIFLQIYDKEGKKQFDKPKNISKTPKVFSWLPKILLTSTEPMEIYVLWQEIVFSGGTHGGEIFFARSTDGGRTFSNPLNLSNDIAGSGKGRIIARYWHNGSLDIAMDKQRNIYTAWTEYEGNLWFSFSSNRGAKFSKPLRIVGNDKPARGPSLAVDNSGNIYIAWTAGEDKSANIHFAKSTDEGQSFSKPQTIWVSAGYSDAPKLAVDSKGTIHLVYSESPTGPFGRYRILYSKSTSAGESFDQPVEISKMESKNFVSMSFPSISVDGKDNLYIIWEPFPDERSHPQGLMFTFSSDSDKTFQTPELIPRSFDSKLGFNGSQQGLLMRKLAVNSAGKIVVVNSTFKRNEKSAIWLFRGKITNK